jgi:hypothetical protein
VKVEPASTLSRQKAKAPSAFVVERGLAVQIASTELAFGVNGAFTGQEKPAVFCLFHGQKTLLVITPKP